MADRKVSVTITHRVRDIQPPLFVAGTFSDPQWTPQEMDFKTGSDGEYIFTKDLEVDPGSKLQYKFRIGHGDWWQLNDDAPTVTDDAGNKNNLLEAPTLEDADLSTQDEAHEDGIQHKTNGVHSSGEDEIIEDHTQHNVNDADPNGQDETNEDITQHDANDTNDTVDAHNAHDADPSGRDEINDYETQHDANDADPSDQDKVIEHDIQHGINDANTNDATPSGSDEIIEVETPHDAKDADPSGQDKIIEDDTQQNADDRGQQLQSLPRIEALKQFEKVDRSGTSTPEYARTAAEVAESAALIDPATPEPEVSNEVAAEVGYRQMTSTPPQEAANTAAEVADTAKALDTNEAGLPVELLSPACKIIADVKDDRKDDSLDIAGYSNDPEPVPLFAHECAGLYEDDEVPGAIAVEGLPESLNGDLHRNTEEDFSDPTLERFPSTRDEIITTVRKVESGLTADQTSFEGSPASPVIRSRTTSIADVLGESQSPEESPKSSRGSRRLSLPRSVGSVSERSLSVVSLGSIAEGAEGEEADHQHIQEEDAIDDEAEDSRAGHISPVPEQAETAEEAIDDGAENSRAGDIAPVAEQAETAQEAIEAAKEAEGEVTLSPAKLAVRPVVTVPSPSVQASNSLLSPVSDEDEAIVLKNGNDKDNSAEIEQSGYPTPEGAATPKPTEPGSPSEPAADAAPPTAGEDVDTVAPVAEAESALSVPPSPQVVVTRAEDTPPEEETLLAASSASEDGPNDTEATPSDNVEAGTESHTATTATPETTTTPEAVKDILKEIDVPPSDHEATTISEVVEDVPKDIEAPPSDLEATTDVSKDIDAAPTGYEATTTTSEVVEDSPKNIETTFDHEAITTSEVVEDDPKDIDAPSSHNEAIATSEVVEDVPKDTEAHLSDREATTTSEVVEDSPKDVEAPPSNHETIAIPEAVEDSPKDIEAPPAPPSDQETIATSSAIEDGSKDVEALQSKHVDAGTESRTETLTETATITPAIEAAPKDIETPLVNNVESGTLSPTVTAATSSAVEDSQPASLRKRPAQQTSSTDRAGTPNSITDTGREAAKSGNWFSAFFRLLFVDWVGGFVNKLCGGKPKT